MALHPKAFLRDMFRAGARKVLHRAGFRQPGGGRTFYRSRGPVTQQVTFWHSWSLDRAGSLAFSASQSLRYVQLWAWESPRRFTVDPFYGDPHDLAVEVGEWFRVELLPAFEVELDLAALAREFEARGHQHDLWRAATVYRELGLEADADRAQATADVDPPF